VICPLVLPPGKAPNNKHQITNPPDGGQALLTAGRQIPISNIE